MRMSTSTCGGIDARRHGLNDLARTLNAVSPLATLQRGYTILLDRDLDSVVRSVGQVDAKTRLIARLVDGDLALLRDLSSIE